MVRPGHFKDQILDQLARRANVAQFVSFDPRLAQRFAWITGHAPNQSFVSPASAVAALLAKSPEHSINIRSFEPHDPKSRDFLYGLKQVDEAIVALRGLAGRGLHTIVNETVDVDDGGVSGVTFGDLVEFAPGDTPRCVEKPGTAAFSRDAAMKLFSIVYGFEPALPADRDLRVEFSLHPIKRGYHVDHTIIWETEEGGTPPAAVDPVWPNRFSRAVGDKTFGLLVAWLSGCSVPQTTVIPRRMAPFRFGRPTGSNEPWIRTSPTEQVPGRFTTARGWLDPFRLMAAEDPDGVALASVLCQEGVTAVASGAAIAQADSSVLIEGVMGSGAEFMVGAKGPDTLPADLRVRVQSTYDMLTARFGAVRFEWVDDGRDLWVVQFHRGQSASLGRTIHPGEADVFRRFDVEGGLEALRSLAVRAREEHFGIVLVGHVGVTSHFGDVLRRAQVPSRLEVPEH